MTSTEPMTLGLMWLAIMRNGDTPVTMAASTYSLPRSTRTRPRTVRAYCTQKEAAIATTRTGMASRSWVARSTTVRVIPSMRSAMRIAGKPSCTSAMRMIDGIEKAAEITADKSKHDPDQGCQEDARSADHQRHAGAEQNG